MEASLISLPRGERITEISPVVDVRDSGSHTLIVITHQNLFEHKERRYGCRRLPQ